MKPISAVTDTCVWISAYSPTEVDHQRSRAYVDRIIRGGIRIALPYPALTEIVCRLAANFRNEKKDPEDAATMGRQLHREPNIEWIAADADFCVQATALGVRHRLRGMDAIVAHTAIYFRCELVTYDTDFLNSSIASVIRVRRP